MPGSLHWCLACLIHEVLGLSQGCLAHRRGAWLVKANPRADNPMFTTAQKRWASFSTHYGQCVVRERQPRPGKLGVVALAASGRTPGCQPQDKLQTREGWGWRGGRGAARASRFIVVFYFHASVIEFYFLFVFVQALLSSQDCVLP